MPFILVSSRDPAGSRAGCRQAGTAASWPNPSTNAVAGAVRRRRPSTRQNDIDTAKMEQAPGARGGSAAWPPAPPAAPSRRTRHQPHHRVENGHERWNACRGRWSFWSSPTTTLPGMDGRELTRPSARRAGRVVPDSTNRTRGAWRRWKRPAFRRSATNPSKLQAFASRSPERCKGRSQRQKHHQGAGRSRHCQGPGRRPRGRRRDHQPASSPAGAARRQGQEGPDRKEAGRAVAGLKVEAGKIAQEAPVEQLWPQPRKAQRRAASKTVRCRRGGSRSRRGGPKC